MKAFSASGVWWLPEAPDEQTAGTVHFDPETGTQLELIGTLIPLHQPSATMLSSGGGTAQRNPWHC